MGPSEYKPLTRRELEQLAKVRDKKGSKLNPAQVTAMLRERIEGASVPELAKKYGVTRATVYTRIKQALEGLSK